MSNNDGSLKDLFSIEATDLPEILSSVVEAGDLAAAASVAKHGAALKWDAVMASLADNFVQLMNMDIRDILAATWSKYKILEEHADATRGSPGKSVLVPLAKHTIESEHHPSIELLVSETSLLKLEFSILLSLELEGALVTIEDGKITKIQPGKGSGKGSVSCRDKTLLQREFDADVFPAALTVEPGIEIQTPELLDDGAGQGSDK
jgi:hypothetical protein